MCQVTYLRRSCVKSRPVAVHLLFGTARGVFASSTQIEWASVLVRYIMSNDGGAATLNTSTCCCPPCSVPFILSSELERWKGGAVCYCNFLMVVLFWVGRLEVGFRASSSSSL